MSTAAGFALRLGNKIACLSTTNLNFHMESKLYLLKTSPGDMALLSKDLPVQPNLQN